MKKAKKNRHSTLGIPTIEVARFLRRLSTIYSHPDTGNPALSAALVQVAQDLRRTQHPLPVKKRQSTTSKSLKVNRGKADKRRDSKSSSKLVEAKDFRDLPPHAIERLIETNFDNKQTLVQLGTQRFSIPKWKLTKLKLADLREAVKAALRNERSLNIISEQARRGGASRSS